MAGGLCSCRPAGSEKVAKQHPDTRAAQQAQDILMQCGAWEVEITDANGDKIVERLKRRHGEHEEGERDEG